MEIAHGVLIAYMPGDGQTCPEDLVAAYNVALNSNRSICTVVKGVRVTRDEGVLRKILSFGHRPAFRLLFGFSDTDVNGVPEILWRQDPTKLNLTSDDSFICTELLVKAQKLGFRIVQVPVRSMPRVAGRSKVTLGLAIAALKHLLQFRLGQGRE